jgi:hypothetical protein
MDVDISHPGSTSDYMAFTVSPLKRSLETACFLSEGMHLFGDNAYVNAPYMVTLYKSPNKSQDHYNFYHSQVPIKVECAFGMLVHWWSILRRPIPASLGILRKVTAFTMCLYSLHNFCIDRRIANCTSLDQDRAFWAARGGVCVQPNHDGANELDPEQLLHGGEHYDDYSCNIYRQAEHSGLWNANGILPRDVLHESVINQGLQRPAEVLKY